MANKADIKISLEGFTHLIQSLGAFKEAVRNKYLRRALMKGARLIRKAARSNIKTGRPGWVATGQLKRSIGMKVGRDKTFNWFAIVGAERYKFSIPMRKRVRGPLAGKEISHDPGRISHLIEFGHGGRSPAPAYPFLRPAYDQSKDAVMDAIRDTLEQGLAAEMRKRAK